MIHMIWISWVVPVYFQGILLIHLEVEYCNAMVSFFQIWFLGWFLDMTTDGHKLVVSMTVIDFEFQMNIRSAPRGQILFETN